MVGLFFNYNGFSCDPDFGKLITSLQLIDTFRTFFSYDKQQNLQHILESHESEVKGKKCTEHVQFPIYDLQYYCVMRYIIYGMKK